MPKDQGYMGAMKSRKRERRVFDPAIREKLKSLRGMGNATQGAGGGTMQYVAGAQGRNAGPMSRMRGAEALSGGLVKRGIDELFKLAKKGKTSIPARKQ